MYVNGYKCDSSQNSFANVVGLSWGTPVAIYYVVLIFSLCFLIWMWVLYCYWFSKTCSVHGLGQNSVNLTTATLVLLCARVMTLIFLSV